jgi:hypothetical protein
MAKASDFLRGKYMKIGDLPQPRRFKLKSVTIDVMGARDDAGSGDGASKPGERKLVLWFTTTDQGLSLNVTNLSWMQEQFGDDTDLWVGKVIELYTDANVLYKSKRTGGIRIRHPAPKQVNGPGAAQAAAEPQPTPNPTTAAVAAALTPKAESTLAEELDDDLDNV